jgi:predicted enzyme related to lactoylglutathione lyase
MVFLCAASGNVCALDHLTRHSILLLGVPPQTDESYYVGFEAAGQHIGLVAGGGPWGMTSPVAYWHVPDLEVKLAEVTATGATVKEPAHDPDGNVLGLLEDR